MATHPVNKSLILPPPSSERTVAVSEVAILLHRHFSPAFLTFSRPGFMFPHDSKTSGNKRRREEVQMKKVLGILAFVVICELAGIIGSIFTTPSIPGWYAALAKPPFNPPNWVFAPVWTLLYALMGIAAYLVYEKGLKRNEVRKALTVFAGQLLLNTLWSVVFFGAHMILGAAGIIIILWGMIALSIWLFSRVSKAAAYLLVPYILWVSFATVLNISLYVLNK
jgi:tryptophan-rich sensory protein